MQKPRKSTTGEIAHKTYSEKDTLVKKTILGVGITNDSKENILEFIHLSLQKSAKPYYIVTPNPEMIVLAKKNSEFRRVLHNAKIALNDGVGVGLAARIMGIPLNERFTGVDLVEKVCEKSNDWPITVGFLGAEPNVAEKAAECLGQRYPKLRVAFVGEEWGKDSLTKKNVLSSKYYVSSKDQPKPKIHNTKYIIQNTDVVDILFIALGAPKQEFWMAEHLGKIPVKVMVGVGGAFDQIVNPSLRPPQFMQTIGFGWLYRLIRQPWRWKRQLALIEFMGMVGEERLKK